jgi:hypothetical protein
MPCWHCYPGQEQRSKNQPWFGKLTTLRMVEGGPELASEHIQKSLDNQTLL